MTRSTRFLSVCSGIEAFSVATEGLPYEPVMFSEIEPFPCAVLAHRQRARDLRRGTAPGRVALWGDMTALRVRHFRRFGILLPDVVVGGTPCQAFSVAGLRRGLRDPRGGLTLDFVRLCHAFAAAGSLRNALWENVPGVLSQDGNPFGCFLGALVGADDALVSPLKRGRWPRSGMVAGPRARAAWRVFDGQFFGLAQQRQRVFVVIDFGGGADPAAVLLERKGMRRGVKTRRKAREIIAALTASGVGFSHLVADAIQERAVSENPDAGPDGAGFRPDLAYTLEARTVPQAVAYGGNNCSGPIDVAPALTAHGGPCGRMDFESETFIAEVAPALRTSGYFDNHGDEGGLIAFDCKSSDPARGVSGDIAGTLRAMAHSASHQNGGGNLAVCVTGTITHALRAEGADASEDGTGRGTPIVAVALRGREGGARMEVGGDVAGTLRASQGGGDKPHVWAGAAVRRLTPRECERLQGFPDDYTLIPWRKGDAPDGLRYRALGNSMAVPVMRWIAERLAAALPDLPA